MSPRPTETVPGATATGSASGIAADAADAATGEGEADEPRRSTVRSGPTAAGAAAVADAVAGSGPAADASAAPGVASGPTPSTNEPTR